MFIQIENSIPIGYPITDDNFRLLFPGTSFPFPLTPDVVESFGFGIYEYSQIPKLELHEKAVEVSPVRNKDGLWMQTWDIVEMTEEEKTAKDAEVAGRIRAERDWKLSQTDGVIIRNTELGTPIPPDVTAYRQALRDLPEQAGFPHEVVWPEPPTAATGPDWYGFYQGLLVQPAFGHIRTAAATSVEIAVAYADAAIALSQAATQRINVPAIQASLDNLLGLMTGPNALEQTEQAGLEELLLDCGLEDTITLAFAS